MQKLVLTNLLSILLTSAIFIMSSNSNNSEDAIIGQNQELKKDQSPFQKSKAKFHRAPSAHHIPEKAVRLAEAKAEIARLKRKLQFDQSNWKDYVQHLHHGSEKLQNETISRHEIYKPFYNDLYKLLAAEYGENDANKKMTVLLELKKEKDQKIEEIYVEESEVRLVAREENDLEVIYKIGLKRKELEEKNFLDPEKLESSLNSYEGKLRFQLDIKTQRPFELKREELQKQYNFEKERLLGKVYIEAEKLKEQYNEEYQKTYGNRVYSTHHIFDEETKSHSYSHEPVEVESEFQMVRIDL